MNVCQIIGSGMWQKKSRQNISIKTFSVIFILFSQDDARETTKEAKDVQEEAKLLANRSINGESYLYRYELEKRKTEMYITENRTKDLLEMAQEANRTAYYAIVNGTRTLVEAKKNLKILEVRILVELGKVE